MPRETTKGRKSKKEAEEGTLRVPLVKPLPAPDPDDGRPVMQPLPSTSAWMWEDIESPPSPGPIQPPPTPEPGDPRPEAKLYELLSEEFDGLSTALVWSAFVRAFRSLAEGDASDAKSQILKAFEAWRAAIERPGGPAGNGPEPLTSDHKNIQSEGVAKQDDKTQSSGQGQAQQENRAEVDLSRETIANPARMSPEERERLMEAVYSAHSDEDAARAEVFGQRLVEMAKSKRPPSKERTLNLQKASDRSGLSLSYLSQLCDEGKLGQKITTAPPNPIDPENKTKPKPRFSEAELDEFVAEERTPGPKRGTKFKKRSPTP